MIRVTVLLIGAMRVPRAGRGWRIKSRGFSEKEGLRKFSELQGVMEELMPLRSLPVGFENQSKNDKIAILEKLASEQAEEASEIYDRNKANPSERNQAAPASGG